MKRPPRLDFAYGQTLRIIVRGEVVFPAPADFEHPLREAYSEWPRDVELDLTDCVFINEGGYAPLLLLMARVRLDGRRFEIVGARDYIRAKIEQMGMEELVTEWRP